MEGKCTSRSSLRRPADEIIGKNPKLDGEKLKESIKLAEKLRELGRKKRPYRTRVPWAKSRQGNPTGCRPADREAGVASVRIVLV